MSAPTWTSPAEGSVFPPMTPLVWQSVVQSQPAHFILELDLVDTYDSEDKIVLESFRGDEGFEYWDGTSWVSFGVAGMPADKTGNGVRYVLWSRGGTWHRRVQQGYRS